MLLCCGEALIDMVPAMTAEKETAFVPRAGGAALNTAISMGRLGGDVALCSGLSTDFFGEQLSAVLSESHVRSDYVVFSDRPTGLSFAVLNNGSAQYQFHDENSAGRMIVSADLPVLGNEITTLLFGGISLAIEPCGAAFETLCAQAHAANVIMLDPNVRPGIISDASAYRDRLSRMIAQSDILKLSDEDLEWLCPVGGSLQGRAYGLLGQGPAIVVVTCGSKGSFAVWGERRFLESDAPKVVVSDTIGAGDTFNAAMLHVLENMGCLTKSELRNLSSKTVEKMLAFSNAAASQSVTRPGADPPWQVQG